MPLPTTGTFPLLGYSRPGETVQSKPKQAMIIRMSPETLDALQSFPNHPQLEFEFGHRTGICIGHEFFSMAPLQEGTPHDLYLRASSATKKIPPFKLYANVVGKFTVQRELGDRVGEKVRESTNDAINKRAGRTAIFIDTPDKMIPNNMMMKGKKKKELTTPRTIRALSPGKVKPSAIAPNPVTTSSASQSSTDGSNPLRRRLVHFLVTEERTEEQVVKAVGGPSCTAPTRQHIQKVLEDVGEPVNGIKGVEKRGIRYRLKPRSWIEVRPYEWPKWTDAERTSVAREGRAAFKALGISETDPVWDHVRYRSNQNGISSSINSVLANNASKSTTLGASDPPKRGVSSHAVKEKTATTRFKPKVAIKMKDEGARSVPKPNEESLSIRESNHPVVRSSSGISGTPAKAVRKQPGTGFRSTPGKASPTPVAEPVHRNVGDNCPLGREQLYSSSHQKPKHKQSARSAQPSNTDIDDLSTLNSEAEGRRHRYRELEMLHEQENPKDKEDREHSDDSLPVKRRNLYHDDDHDDLPTASWPTAQKRRKTESVSVISKPPALDIEYPRSRQSDIDTQNLANLIKKELSPALQTSVKHIQPIKRLLLSSDKSPQISASSTSAHFLGNASNAKSNKSNISTKSRRRSPIYTSSEDEEQSQRGTVRALPTPPKNIPQIVSHMSQHARLQASRPRTNPVRSFRVDRAALRAKYNASYVEYLNTLHRLAIQRSKIDNLLKDHDNGSTASITDSEGDIELLSPEDLAGLAAEHKKLHEELESIRRMFAKSENGTGGSSN